MLNSADLKVDVAQVIGQAAQSTLGVLSLICLILGVIAYAFFKHAGERIKLMVCHNVPHVLAAISRRLHSEPLGKPF